MSWKASALTNLTAHKSIYMSSKSASDMPVPRVPIHRLPLPPVSRRLQAQLPRVPLPALTSHQRRSKVFPSKQDAGIWARVNPLPLPFPYRAPPDWKGEGPPGVEEVLGMYEPQANDITSSELSVGTTDKRLEWQPELLGLAKDAVEQCLPHLDVGDALDLCAGKSTDSAEATSNEARDMLVDVLWGRKVLYKGQGAGPRDLEQPVDEEEYGPWSTRYAGHQFGHWAGQLGDGRAISLLETVSEKGGKQEIQLKGSGRTPFSRSADGLAVLRSGVREFLGAEAMAALGVATTRSLAILTTSQENLPVMREHGLEPNSIVSRLAPSFIRTGHFEILNPPKAAMEQAFFVMGLGMVGEDGSGADKRDWEGLRSLGEWVAGEFGIDQSAPWARAVAEESIRRNAEMVAGWQAYGFMHGVINTDNVSVLGLTIDYGPYAFMDVYNERHVCNHSDEEGRYDYQKQPQMVMFAMNALVNSLSHVIGYEATTGKTPKRGWAQDATDEDKDAWRIRGHEEMQGWAERFMATYATKLGQLWRKRFGLLTTQSSDIDSIVKPFLKLLQQHEVDFHSSFRTLTRFRPETDNSAVIVQLTSGIKSETGREDAAEDFTKWLTTYATRVTSDDEKLAWESFTVDETESATIAYGPAVTGGEAWLAKRETEVRRWNPRFVLRQWVLEETIGELEERKDIKERRAVLARILEMSSKPFYPWGEGDELSADEQAAKRLCGMGKEEMLGFQCSCSS